MPAFTSRYPGASRVLINNVLIYACSKPTSLRHPQTDKKRQALWDTGASGSAIRKGLAQELGLVPVSIAKVHTPQGSYNSPCYYVDVYLPTGVIIPRLLVTEGLTDKWDMLVGMDIIGQGDFAVTNHQGKTVFSFRMPSMTCFDFVSKSYLEPDKVDKVPGRNDLCSCGSGIKYKNCCGKSK